MTRRVVFKKLPRRAFLRRTAYATCGAAFLSNSSTWLDGAESQSKSVSSPIVVFSKIYQSLKLSFDEAAGLTAEAGLAGVDCPVRPAGEILPENVADELPRYVEALQKRGLQLPLLTTAITSVSSPHAALILRTAKKLGVRYYRIGFVERRIDQTAAKQVQEIRAQLNDVAVMNKEIGIGALVQNHSPSGHSYLGGDLNEMEQIVSGFDPAQVGVAFDIGHALIVHGDGWRSHFEKLKSHLKIAYLKDAKRDGVWVPFGQGDVGKTGYFNLLKKLHYHAPVSMHIEYDWDAKGKDKTHATLLRALKESSTVVKQWLSQG